jgi:inosine-uridine nucleoside N-ribohydrolase
VITDNDYAGDPDGLFQLVHLLLSPSVDVRLVVGSHLAPGDPFDPSDTTADDACVQVEQVLALLGRSGGVPVAAGSNVALTDARTPHDSAAARAIVAEAMREDTGLPLFAVFGGGLTELASAWLLEPRIAQRMTAIWIGGPEYGPGHGDGPFPPADAMYPEYNMRIDVTAAQVVFGDSDIPLWQVPRNAYRQTLASFAELDLRVGAAGPVGEWLMATLHRVEGFVSRAGGSIGETYVLGDSPLVLLTALQSSFEPDPSSSEYRVVPAPRIADDGSYRHCSNGRGIRVYTRLDVRLMLEDLYAKLARLGRAQGSSD